MSFTRLRPRRVGDGNRRQDTADSAPQSRGRSPGAEGPKRLDAATDALIKNPPPGAAVAPILPPQEGFLFFDRANFAASIAADVNADAAAFMADSQVPWGVEALGGAVSEPARKTERSWYLVSTEDKMIPPDAQRAMSKRAGSTVVEVKGSYAVYVSQPQVVATLIERGRLDGGSYKVEGKSAERSRSQTDMSAKR